MEPGPYLAERGRGSWWSRLCRLQPSGADAVVKKGGQQRLLLAPPAVPNIVALFEFDLTPSLGPCLEFPVYYGTLEFPPRARVSQNPVPCPGT